MDDAQLEKEIWSKYGAQLKAQGVTELKFEKTWNQEKTFLTLWKSCLSPNMYLNSSGIYKYYMRR